MDVFIREDGKPLQVIEGFRDHFARLNKTTKPEDNWSAEDYEEAAKTKIKGSGMATPKNPLGYC